MGTRSLNRPAYVLALLLGLVAIEDAGNGLLNMQMPPLCRQYPLGINVDCSASGSGWLVDIGAAIISAALLALLLLRPNFPVFAATLGWAALAFVANLAMRHSENGPDTIATFRMTIYILAAVIAAVLVSAEYLAQTDAERRAAAPAAPPALAPAPRTPAPTPAVPPPPPAPPAAQS
jgi:hypothetical protein